MLGNEIVIAKLNDILSEELAAINQYSVHAAMCDNWGYDKLHDEIECHARKEMEHAPFR